jgi:predicted  nucleic acid-binding Zn-ribbon protein
MSLIIRTWGCQNKACLSVFDSGERNPACPRCGCVRVGWVPGRVNVGSDATRAADADLKTLAARFGLTDLNSAEAGRQAKKLALPANGGAAGVVNFGGFAAAIDPQAARSNANQSGAQCLPTVNRIDAKVRMAPGEKLTGQLGLPSLAVSRR